MWRGGGKFHLFAVTIPTNILTPVALLVGNFGFCWVALWLYCFLFAAGVACGAGGGKFQLFAVTIPTTAWCSIGRQFSALSLFILAESGWCGEQCLFYLFEPILTWIFFFLYAWAGASPRAGGGTMVPLNRAEGRD